MKYCKIKKYEQYGKLFKNGKRAYSATITVIYRPAREMGMGIALSKKYGHAVVRNRIKRLLRVAFAEKQDILERNYSVILIPKMAEEYSLSAFEKGLESCFKKVNLCSQKQ